MKILGRNTFTESDHTKLNDIGTTISTAQANAIIANTAKVDLTVDGAGTVHSNNYTDTNTTYSIQDGELSQNNFTNDDHTKLNGIAAGAEVNVQSDWNSSSGDNQILNKPTIPVDLTADGAGTVHANNYTDTNTQLPLIDSDSMSGASATNVASAESVKAYVDARYSYQYISFFGSVSAANNNNGGPYYIFTSGNGISNHSWTKYNVGGTLAITNDTIDLDVDANCSQLTVSTYFGTNQIVVPQTSEIVGFYATNRAGSNGPYHVGNAIFVIPESGVNWGDSNSMTAFLKYRSISSAHSGTDENFSSSNVNTSKTMMCHDMARGTYEVAAGSIIIPSIFCDTHSQVIASSMTIVLRTKV